MSNTTTPKAYAELETEKPVNELEDIKTKLKVNDKKPSRKSPKKRAK